MEGHHQCSPLIQTVAILFSQILFALVPFQPILTLFAWKMSSDWTQNSTRPMRSNNNSEGWPGDDHMYFLGNEQPSFTSSDSTRLANGLANGPFGSLSRSRNTPFQPNQISISDASRPVGQLSPTFDSVPAQSSTRQYQRPNDLEDIRTEMMQIKSELREEIVKSEERMTGKMEQG